MGKSLLWTILSNTPLPIVKGMARCLSKLHYLIDQKHVQECESMVDMTEQGWDSRATIRSMYQHIWKLPEEMLLLQKEKEAFGNRVHNLQEFKDHCLSKADGKGIIFVSAHMGNWEIGSNIISEHILPVSAIFKPHKKKWVNDLYEDMRGQGGQANIPKEGGLIPILRVLKANKGVGLLTDQYGGKEGIRSKFLGKTTTSWDSPVQLSFRTKCPIIPITFVRDGHGFKYNYHPEYQITLDENQKLDVEKSTLDLDQALSDLIAQTPEQWLWLGRKWGRDFKTLMKELY